MDDVGRIKTNQQLSELEGKIADAYKVSLKEIDDFFAEFSENDKKMQEKVKKGQITEKYYKKWKKREIEKSNHYKQMKKIISEKLTNCDKIAADYINSDLPNIYTTNRNYEAFSIENATSNMGTSFSLVDESTVKRLIETEPELLPNYPTKRAIDKKLNVNYYQKSITKRVTTGILLGESNQTIAKRLMKDLPNLGKTNAIRAARTATTNAENAGRYDTFVAAENRGIDVKRQWIATHDGRTRLDHIIADGQIVEVKKPFKVGGSELMFPGDKNGRPEQVYNCRCSQLSVINGRVNYNPNKQEVYEKWLKDKQELEEKKRAIAKKKNKETTTRKNNSQQDEKLRKEVEKEQADFKKNVEKVNKIKRQNKAVKKTTKSETKKQEQTIVKPKEEKQEQVQKEKLNGIRDMNLKFTKAEIDGMSRKDLETASTAIFIKQHKDMSEYDAMQRVKALLDGNTNSQLKKYIKKYGR